MKLLKRCSYSEINVQITRNYISDVHYIKLPGNQNAKLRRGKKA